MDMHGCPQRKSEFQSWHLLFQINNINDWRGYCYLDNSESRKYQGKGKKNEISVKSCTWLELNMTI